MNQCLRASSERADEQGSDKAGRIGDSNRVDIVPGASGVSDSLTDYGIDDFDVAAGRYLWYNSAVLFVNIDLSLDDIAKKLTAVFDDRRSSFIATGFYAQNFHYC
jgi:hypothetical protein